MKSVPSLHSICFDYIKTHSEDVISLEGIPYKPVVENLIEYLFTSKIPLNQTILSVIPYSHSKALRSAKYRWTELNYHNPIYSIYPVLQVISLNFPKFITRLKIGLTDLCDNDIYLLRNLTNLQVLNLDYNQNITDRTVSYIASMTTDALYTSNGGLPYLEELYLDHVKGITDKSLKFFGKMTLLCRVSLTGSGVNPDVTKTYLKSQGYQIFRESSFFHSSTPPSTISNRKLYLFLEGKARQYDVPAGRTKYNPNLRPIKTPVFLEFKRELTRTSNKNIPKVVEKPIVKKQKLNTDNFLAMFEAEIANDCRLY